LDAGVCIEDSGGRDARCMPSMIVIGTGKGGTAEVQSWLSRHPNMRRTGDAQSVSGGGEADYFGRELKTEKQLEGTWRKYLQQWQPQEIESLAQHYTFEKSPGYLSHSTYPKLMKMLIPNVKLVRARAPNAELACGSWVCAARRGGLAGCGELDKMVAADSALSLAPCSALIVPPLLLALGRRLLFFATQPPGRTRTFRCCVPARTAR